MVWDQQHNSFRVFNDASEASGLLLHEYVRHPAIRGGIETPEQLEAKLLNLGTIFFYRRL